MMNPGLLLLLGVGLGIALTLLVVGIAGLRQSFRAQRGIYLTGNNGMARRLPVSLPEPMEYYP